MVWYVVIGEFLAISMSDRYRRSPAKRTMHVLPPKMRRPLTFSLKTHIASTMTAPKKTYFNWSTGKDSSFALYKMLQRPDEFTIDLLLTSVNTQFNRVSMHGIRRELLEKQAQAIGLPLTVVDIPGKVSMEEYQVIMKTKVEELRMDGYTCTGFGDIFLEDLRKSRVDKLRPYGIECVFPLWKIDTKELIRDFLASGFRTIVVCTQGKLGETFVGREIDEQFLSELPPDIDFCGEHGEFHTFCFDGPIFSSPVRFQIGERTYRENVYEGVTYGNWFCDLLPVEEHDNE